jgi:hypothetical protein
LLLAKPTSTYSGLAGIHPRFVFDKHGSLSVVIENPRKPMVALGDDEFDQGSRVITRCSARIMFGEMAYMFTFTTAPGKAESQYQKRLSVFLRDIYDTPAPPPNLSATPSETNYLMGDWIIRGTVGQGTFGAEQYENLYQYIKATCQLEGIVRSY